MTQDQLFWSKIVRWRRLVLGTVLLLAVVASATATLRSEQWTNSIQLIRGLARHSLSKERVYSLRSSEDFPLRDGDPIFGKDRGNWHMIGVVRRSTNASSSGPMAVHYVQWSHSEFEPIAGQNALYCETPTSFSWVAQALLPEEKRRRLSQSLQVQFRRHQAELVQDLEPLIVQSFRDLTPLIEVKLRESFKAHRSEIEELGMRYQAELVEKKLIPLIKSEVIPILEERSRPLMQKMGGELFEKASVWRFTWRYLYDVSPLPQRDLVQTEFNRFVEKDAIPILESHAEEILSTIKDAAIQISKNPSVRQTARDAASDLFHDPQMRAILAETLRDLFVDSTEMKDALRRNWNGEAGQRFARTVESFIDPWLREVGAELIGTPDEGLTTEFVAVLRSQVLAKDKRWIEIPIQPVGASPDASKPTKRQTVGSEATIDLARSNSLPLFPILGDREELNSSRIRASVP